LTRPVDPQAAAALGLSAGWVRSLIKRWNAEGSEGLVDRRKATNCGRDRWGVSVAKTTGRRRPRGLGFSPHVSRPRHPEGVGKTPWPGGSIGSDASVPTRRSRYGPRPVWG